MTQFITFTIVTNKAPICVNVAQISRFWRGTNPDTVRVTLTDGNELTVTGTLEDVATMIESKDGSIISAA